MSAHLGPYCVNTYPYTFDRTAIDTLKHLSEDGYGAFELMMFPGHIWPPHTSGMERKEIASFIDVNGYQLTTLNQPNIDLNIGAAVREMRESSVTVIERTILLAADIGAQGVIVAPGKANPFFPADYGTMRSRYFEALDRFCPMAEKLGVQILLENMPSGFVNSAKEMVQLLDDYGNPEIGVVYDVANGAFLGELFDEAVLLIGERLKYIHLSDTPKSECRHDPINGSGIVDFHTIAATLGSIGYSEPLILEVISSKPDDDLRESIRTFEGISAQLN